MASKIIVSCIIFLLSLVSSITKSSQIGVNIDQAHSIISSSNRLLQTYQGDLSCENGGVQGPINSEGFVKVFLPDLFSILYRCFTLKLSFFVWHYSTTRPFSR